MRTLKEQLENFERQIIEEKLVETNGDVRAAARTLGVRERTLWNRIGKLFVAVKRDRVGVI